MQTNSSWLPTYCDPGTFLPTVQETVVLFAERPYLFQDFVGKAITFLRGETAKKMGFVYDPKTALPCKWKCSDEAVFGIDLILHAYTGHYPFDKGKIGGYFNEASVGAAVHHSATNIDFGGSHVGYQPGPHGGSFGSIQRPLFEHAHSDDCGHMMALLAPFKGLYDDACRSIRLLRVEGEPQVMISVPNEYLQPAWSSHSVKLLVDVERVATAAVPYDVTKPHTHKLPGRSLLYVRPEFLEALPPETLEELRSRPRVSLGSGLGSDYFAIFDADAEIHAGVPTRRILPYMKYILSSRLAPFALKASVTNSNLEYNKLTDCVRAEQFRPYSFASFTGVFIDIYDEEIGAYVNLFQPIGISIKPAGRAREFEISPAEIHHLFDRLEPAESVFPLEGVLGYKRPGHLLDKFTFRPGHFAVNRR